MTYTIEAVGHVRGGRRDPIDDDWGHVRSAVELDPAIIGADALAGLEAFGHAEIIFLLDQVALERIDGGPKPTRPGRLAAHRHFRTTR